MNIDVLKRKSKQGRKQKEIKRKKTHCNKSTFRRESFIPTFLQEKKCEEIVFEEEYVQQKRFDRLNIALFESEQFSSDEEGVHDIRQIFDNLFSIQRVKKIYYQLKRKMKKKLRKKN